MVRIAGVGALKPNTAVLKFHEETRPHPTSSKRDYFRDNFSRFSSERMDELFPQGRLFFCAC